MPMEVSRHLQHRWISLVYPRTIPGEPSAVRALRVIGTPPTKVEADSDQKVPSGVPIPKRDQGCGSSGGELTGSSASWILGATPERLACVSPRLRSRCTMALPQLGQSGSAYAACTVDGSAGRAAVRRLTAGGTGLPAKRG